MDKRSVLTGFIAGLLIATLGWQELGPRGMKCRQAGGSYFIADDKCVRFIRPIESTKEYIQIK